MALEVGTLVEVNMPNDKKEKLAIIKINQSLGIVVLEDLKTGAKTQMSFDFFMESTGIQLDTRTLLKG